jgi:hypothetical protein
MVSVWPHIFTCFNIYSAPAEADDSGIGLEKTITVQQSPLVGPTVPQLLPDDDLPLESDDARPNLDEPVAEALFASDTRPSELNHRRKRGDTIRASDFARPIVSESVAAPTTRRTRSGTVTLEKPAGASRGRHARKSGKLPTIKMKIDNEPLPPQGSDEDDDELLLKPGVYWQD